jgi:apolipoprotein D and lipocalin family protein
MKRIFNMAKIFSVLSLLVLLLVLLTGCTGKADSRFIPVTGFDLSRYLGTWYEIARLDHSFERGLEKVTAEYSIREDGKVRVVNRGYNPEKDKWKRAEGRAELKHDPGTGWLKVSFFRPFYADYMILDLDMENYNYALVSGPNTSYLWILSRTPVLDRQIVNELMAKAETFGFNPEDLIFINQDAEIDEDERPVPEIEAATGPAASQGESNQR